MHRDDGVPHKSGYPAYSAFPHRVSPGHRALRLVETISVSASGGGSHRPDSLKDGSTHWLGQGQLLGGRCGLQEKIGAYSLVDGSTVPERLTGSRTSESLKTRRSAGSPCPWNTVPGGRKALRPGSYILPRSSTLADPRVFTTTCFCSPIQVIFTSNSPKPCEAHRLAQKRILLLIASQDVELNTRSENTRHGRQAAIL